ncbi:MAG TPA: polysaccharide biosynthesis/export family protein [Fimbriiglobus sp.]|jgi:polysaccharide export outer membrane protein
MSRCRSARGIVPNAVLIALFGTGCAHTPLVQPPEKMPELNLPKELQKVSQPTYVVETPDILLINATRVIPLPPYRVEPLDQIYVVVQNTLSQNDPDARINGIYPIDPDGTINLGVNYGGAIRVVDLTTPEIERMLARHLRPNFKEEVKVSVSLAQSRGSQVIHGEHLVRPDGTVSLGTYGKVYVAGMTLEQVKAAIEAQLGKVLYRPEVDVDVFAYNSKFYYVITDFAGNGEQVVKVPCTGNETVLDAIANIGGLSAVSSKNLWVARPAPAGSVDQILPVDWKGITRRGHTRTNYQILPGDRVFVMSQPMVKTDTYLGKALAPIERMFGASLLGFTTFKTFETSGQYGLFGNNNGGQ